MAIEFDCFLIDEVLAAGDARFHQRCHEELFVKRKSRSMIIVSHHTDSVTLHCDSAAVLYNGRLHHFPSVDKAYEFYQQNPN
jgi:capsular polysaccharide transport system ATP-binding protein